MSSVYIRRRFLTTVRVVRGSSHRKSMLPTFQSFLIELKDTRILKRQHRNLRSKNSTKTNRRFSLTDWVGIYKPGKSRSIVTVISHQFLRELVPNPLVHFSGGRCMINSYVILLPIRVR